MGNIIGILRSDSPGSVTIGAGTMVSGLIQPGQSGADRIWICSVRDQSLADLVRVDDVLPIKEFLKRQPADQFWAVVNKSRMRSGRAAFITWKTNRWRLGLRPFRFESRGEVIYFLKGYRPDEGDRYYIVYFEDFHYEQYREQSSDNRPTIKDLKPESGRRRAGRPR